MKLTRRSILRKASTLPALTLGASGFAAAADCSSSPTWDAATLYAVGDRVHHSDQNGIEVLWEAELESRNAEPSRDSAYWNYVGDCGSGGGDNEAPTASFTTSPATPAPEQQVSFDASGSSDADGSINSYEWDFTSDGTTDATEQTATHTYTTAGDYLVTLTVTDDAGATAASSTTITVQADGGGTTGDSMFAPFDHMTTNPETNLIDHYQQAGNDAVAAAFVLSDGNGNAAWDGAADMLVGEAGLVSEIQAYQDQGGSVIVSFGGAVGTMIAQDTTDIAKIKREYQRVIDTYGVTHLDFDIESADEAAVDRRNQALAELQAENTVHVSYTLRCQTTGLTSHGQYVVENAKSHGVDLETINIMTMNYGWVPPNASTIKDSATGTHSDLTSIFPNKSSSEIWGMIGITPMIGVNNVGGTHELADAQEVASFAQNKGIGFVSLWSLDRDNGGCPDGSVSATCSGISQDPYEFSHIYNQVQ
ncbi:PKD domain-containing protein [Halocatena marina]|uniref:PKD domain-containing protein n=1 Tax=Halocatena marina TaxID=2934937 RepID=UPI002413CF9C|nr:PKD domain-containing protein [Halocatena marina]